MIFDLLTFTLIHVVVSLVGIFAGLVVVGGFMAGVRFSGWIGLYLVTTVVTNVTGFGFPFGILKASHFVGVISLVVLAVAIAALYWKHLTGAWRTVFVVSSVLALYLNIFVLIVQLFSKTPALIALAPNQSEPAFVVTHLIVLAIFVVLGRASVKGFRNERSRLE